MTRQTRLFTIDSHHLGTKTSSARASVSALITLDIAQYQETVREAYTLDGSRSELSTERDAVNFDSVGLSHLIFNLFTNTPNHSSTTDKESHYCGALVMALFLWLPKFRCPNIRFSFSYR